MKENELFLSALNSEVKIKRKYQNVYPTQIETKSDIGMLYGAYYK